MQGSRDRVFAAIGVCFSALLLVLSLLAEVRTAEAMDRAAALDRRCRELQTENSRLEVQLESSLSLEEIEHWAVEVFGMQPRSTAQTIYVEYPGD